MLDEKKDQPEFLDPESDVERHDEERHEDERAEQDDLNQGMSTGTHDTTKYGVNWGDAYQIRPGSETDPPKTKKAPKE